jgi:ubiquitin-protein ligase
VDWQPIFPEKIEMKNPNLPCRNMALRRLQREFSRSKYDNSMITNVGIRDENLLNWHATLLGQQGTRFAGEEFPVEISFTLSYPFQPPKLRFLVPVDHISVSDSGAVCMDILDDAWSPAFTAELILVAALSIICDSDERILQDVDEVIEELRNEVNIKKTRKNRNELRLKLKERDFKCRHSE